MTLWLAIPVMVFSFNHSPIISSFAVAKREEYGEGAEKKCSKILAFAHIMMVLTVMFFVFSCVLSLTPADLAAAKEQNISILSYLANHFNAPIIAMILFLMPMYAIQKVPAMRKYSGHISNVFVVIMGLIAISAIFYSLFS